VIGVTPPKRKIITLKAKPKPPDPAKNLASEPPVETVSKTKLGKERLKVATAWLEATWPLAFRSPLRPLAIGCGDEVRAHGGGFSVGEIDAALKAWTHRPDYQRAIVAGRMRVRLDGEDGGVITEPEREHAVERLKKLEKKRTAASDESDGPARTTTTKTDDQDRRKSRASKERSRHGRA
jgi:sRNA-binding protein